MLKGIECFVEGDIRLFKQRVSLPASAHIRADTETLLRFFLYGQNCDLYPAVKAAAHHPDIAFESSFFVRDVVIEDLQAAELALLLPASLEGISRAKSQKPDAPLRLHSRLAQNQRRYIHAGSGLHLCHQQLVETMVQKGFTAGVSFDPLETEPGSQIDFSRWFIPQISNDLGPAYTQERFVTAFSRNSWNGADLNTTLAFGDGDFLYGTPRFVEFLLNMPENQRGKIDFEPIELI